MYHISPVLCEQFLLYTTAAVLLVIKYILWFIRCYDGQIYYYCELAKIAYASF